MRNQLPARSSRFTSTGYPGAPMKYFARLLVVCGAESGGTFTVFVKVAMSEKAMLKRAFVSTIEKGLMRLLCSHPVPLYRPAEWKATVKVPGFGIHSLTISAPASFRSGQPGPPLPDYDLLRKPPWAAAWSGLHQAVDRTANRPRSPPAG